MDGRTFPDFPGPHRVCGRECLDGSACGNTVDSPGDSCHLHPEDAPRADGGPTDPSEVPLSGSAGGVARAGLMVGKALAVAGTVWMGLGPFVTDVAVHLAGVLTALALAAAVDAYQRRAFSESNGPD